MASHNPRIATVILAAGASKRMREPKQLLKWEDSTLIEHTIKKALQLNVHEVVVVLGANYNKIQSRIEQYPITILNNTNWEVGLGKSIAFAAEYLITSKFIFDGVLFVLADQPFVSITHLNQILSALKPSASKIIATKYHSGKIGVPVLFDSTYLSELSQLTGDNGANFILKAHNEKITVLTPNFENKDIDTKADYKTLNPDF